MKISKEIAIMIGIVLVILLSHLFCGCSQYSLMEGLENAVASATKDDASTAPTGKSDDKDKKSTDDLHTQSGLGDVAPAGNTVTKAKAGDSKTGGVTKEGFVGANTNYGESSLYSLKDDTPIDTSSWFQPNLVITPGQPLSPGVQAINNRPKQPIPLPEGEMVFFADTQFKPECCPSSYSVGHGCACMTTQQYNYLTHRGGNNVPYSEY